MPQDIPVLQPVYSSLSLLSEFLHLANKYLSF